MNYLLKTTVATFAVFLLIFVILANLVDLLNSHLDLRHSYMNYLIPLFASPIVWSVTGYASWMTLLCLKPINLNQDIIHFWIKKFVLITTVTGVVYSFGNILLGIWPIYLSQTNPMITVITNLGANFALPVGFAVAWLLFVHNKPIPEEFLPSYHWAKRIIFITIVFASVFNGGFIQIPLFTLLPYPIGLYLTYAVMLTIDVLATLYAFRNFKPLNLEN